MTSPLTISGRAMNDCEELTENDFLIQTTFRDNFCRLACVPIGISTALVLSGALLVATLMTSRELKIVNEAAIYLPDLLIEQIYSTTFLAVSSLSFLFLVVLVCVVYVLIMRYVNTRHAVIMYTEELFYASKLVEYIEERLAADIEYLSKVDEREEREKRAQNMAPGTGPVEFTEAEEPPPTPVKKNVPATILVNSKRSSKVSKMAVPCPSAFVGKIPTGSVRSTKSRKNRNHSMDSTRRRNGSKEHVKTAFLNVIEPCSGEAPKITASKQNMFSEEGSFEKGFSLKAKKSNLVVVKKGGVRRKTSGPSSLVPSDRRRAVAVIERRPKNGRNFSGEATSNMPAVSLMSMVGGPVATDRSERKNSVKIRKMKSTQQEMRTALRKRSSVSARRRNTGSQSTPHNKANLSVGRVKRSTTTTNNTGNTSSTPQIEHDKTKVVGVVRRKQSNATGAVPPTPGVVRRRQSNASPTAASTPETTGVRRKQSAATPTGVMVRRRASRNSEARTQHTPVVLVRRKASDDRNGGENFQKLQRKISEIKMKRNKSRERDTSERRRKSRDKTHSEKKPKVIIIRNSKERTSDKIVRTGANMTDNTNTAAEVPEVSDPNVKTVRIITPARSPVKGKKDKTETTTNTVLMAPSVLKTLGGEKEEAKKTELTTVHDGEFTETVTEMPSVLHTLVEPSATNQEALAHVASKTPVGPSKTPVVASRTPAVAPKTPGVASKTPIVTHRTRRTPQIKTDGTKSSEPSPQNTQDTVSHITGEDGKL